MHGMISDLPLNRSFSCHAVKRDLKCLPKSLKTLLFLSYSFSKLLSDPTCPDGLKPQPVSCKTVKPALLHLLACSTCVPATASTLSPDAETQNMSYTVKVDRYMYLCLSVTHTHTIKKIKKGYVEHPSTAQVYNNTNIVTTHM